MPTGIEWTEETWNPVTGCSKVSPGCAHCYAETIAKRFGGTTAYPEFRPWTPENAAHNVVLHPERLDQPLRWQRPRMVFVNSMSDLFHELVPDTFIAEVFDAMARSPQHTFQVLTKRPERALEWMHAWVRAFDRPGPWPLSNVWLGVSIENARHTYRADVLREIPAAVRFISAEPLLGSLFVGPDRNPPDTDFIQGFRKPLDLTGIDWVIVGGESGTGARPCDLAWIREIRDATLNRAEPTMHQVPGGVDVWENERPALFVKQLGANPTYLDDLTIGVYKEKPLKLRDRKGGDIDEWPVDLRIREFPVRAAVLV